MPGLYTGATGLWGGFSGLLYGTALSTPPGLLADAAQSFSPLELFATGAPGVWYDSSDFSTMFQDAAGTTPVTAVEQPVGLRLDKSRNGVGTNGAKRVNLLTYTEQFDNAAWVKEDATIGASQVSAPDGTSTAEFLRENTINTDHVIYQTVTSASAAYTFSIYVRAAGRNFVAITMQQSLGPAYAIYNLSTGDVETSSNGTSGSATTANIYPAANGYWLCVLRSTVTSGSLIPIVCISNSASPSLDAYNRPTYSGNDPSTNPTGLHLWGADLRLTSEASTLPTYQPITATWRDTIPGSHAYQTTNINRPVLSARYNLLTRTEEFDNAAWLTFDSASKSGTTTLTAAFGTLASSQVYEVVTAASGSYIFRVQARAVTTGKKFRLKIFPGTVDSYSSDFSPSSDWQTFEYAYTGAIANIAVTNESGGGTGTIEFRYPDIRVSNDGVGLPNYQRVTTATDYDTTGFPLYLRYNGTNSTMQTAAIDFTSTDAVSVFAGIRKIVDTAGIIYELSSNTATTNGAFLCAVNGWAGNTEPGTYVVSSRGTAVSYAQPGNNTYPAPETAVLAHLADISSDSVVFRRNGSQAASKSDDQGTGNYGNHALYLGARAGNQLWFNGRDYGIIIVGKTVTAAELANTENYMEVQTFGKDMAYVYTDPVYAADGVTEITAADGDPIYMSVSYV